MIEQDNLHSAPLSVALRDAKQTSVGVVVPESPLFPDDDPYFRELLSFAESIKNDTPPTVTLEDAREAVRVARAAITSIETNQPVNL
jgi:predicted dehydrogenase